MTHWFDQSQSAKPVDVTCDVLVLGAGVAACQAAIASAKRGARVRMVGHARGASPFILGFNVPLAVHLGDSTRQFEMDTFQGGYALGNPALIKLLAREAPVAFDELARAGVLFEHVAGRPALRHLSGSRFPRSVFVKTGTGNAIHNVLSAELDRLGVVRHVGFRVLRIVAAAGRVMGALACAQDGTLHAFAAGNTVLALGGIGGLYDNSTYPTDVVGDAFALALDVGATLIDMEFVQFEPTVVLHPERVRGMEMPTAMLGDGAVMLNADWERFMWRYNPDHGENLIEKAKMALCIQTEVDDGRGTPRGGVWFDATPLGEECLRGYETHYRRLMAAGLDPAKQAVEVAPAAHSLMGGVRIDASCRTGVPGLLACGEAAGGLHGASRIAGNGAADAVVLSRIAGRTAAAEATVLDEGLFRRTVEAECALPAAGDTGQVRVLLATLSKTLAQHVGIRRSGEGLRTAIDILAQVAQEVREHWDGSIFNAYARPRNAVLVAEAITRSALLREESRGAHFRTDFPEMDEDWACSIAVRRQPDDRLALERNGARVEVDNG